MSTFEPGTVAVATVRGVEGVRVMRTDGVESGSDHWLSVENVKGWRSHTRRDVADVRPLVVLDPEDDAVRTFVRKHRDGTGNPACGYSIPIVEAIEAQTRPPRIPEPGFGAIVSTLGTFSGEPKHWIRGRKGWTNLEATGAYLNWTHWDQLIDPVLVREGVES